MKKKRRRGLKEEEEKEKPFMEHVASTGGETSMQRQRPSTAKNNK